MKPSQNHPISHFRLLFFTALLLTACSLNAESTQTANAKPDKVTIYLQGAHIYYSEQVNLAAGTNEVVFENISPNIVESSLQASCRNAVVMEVKHLFRYKEKVVPGKKYDKELRLVLDSLADLEFDLKEIHNKREILTIEKNTLLGNRMMKGQQLRDSLALFRDGMAYLKEKLNAIYDQDLKLDRSQARLMRIKNELNERYNTLLQLQNGQAQSASSGAVPVHQVVVTLYAETAVSGTVRFNYFVNGAQWAPQYELQATSSSGSFVLKYLAAVQQNTGLDWTNVPLTFSTANPSETNNKPVLTPWYLGYQVITQYHKQPMMQEDLVKRTTKAKAAELDEEKDISNYISVTQNLIRTEYEVNLNYSIKSDGKLHKVVISQKEVPMILEFATVPKVCTDAFLMARVTGWEDMNLLPGNSRLYFDGSYVGEMYLNSPAFSDTMSLNLGRDKTISVTRKQVREKVKVRYLEDVKIETRTVEIVLRNSKTLPVTIVVEDQVPVVNGTNEITVSLLEQDGAYLNEANGILSWKLKIDPRETKKLSFTYEVRYPKGKSVVGL